MENKIFVYANEFNKGIFKFTKCNIETPVYIGKNGVTNDKREGDGKTPLGEFGLGISLRMKEDITKDMYWVDDIKSKYYNQLVDITKVKKDWESAEHLIDYPVEYEYLIEIKTNPNNIPDKGSAIFLHCANNKPTAGCIAVERNIMEKIIENVDEKTCIEILLERC